MDRFLFSELTGLPFDQHTNRINEEEIRKRLPGTPQDVVQQVFSDHGRTTDLQRQYGDLELSSLVWESTTIPADKLNVSVRAHSEKYFAMVEERASKVTEDHWLPFNCTLDVRAYWREQRTWMRSPVLLIGTNYGNAQPSHLFEGHTRIASLKGLLRAGLVDSSSLHRAWVGRTR